MDGNRTQPRRRFGRGAALFVAGAVSATALTGIAFAADDEPAPSNTETAAPGWGGPGTKMGHLHHGPGGVPGMGSLLHGEHVVETPDGDYVEIAVQNGQITAVSATSITVRSEDGYSRTYTINADTKIRVDRAGADAGALAVDRPARLVADSAGVALRIGSTTAAGQAAIEERREDRAEMREKFRERFLEQKQEQENAAGDSAA